MFLKISVESIAYKWEWYIFILICIYMILIGIPCDVWFILSDWYQRGSFFLRRNAFNRPKHVAGPTSCKVQSFAQTCCGSHILQGSIPCQTCCGFHILQGLIPCLNMLRVPHHTRFNPLPKQIAGPSLPHLTRFNPLPNMLRVPHVTRFNPLSAVS